MIYVVDCARRVNPLEADIPLNELHATKFKIKSGSNEDNLKVSGSFSRDCYKN